MKERTVFDVVIYETAGQLKEATAGILKINRDHVEILDESKLRSSLIDDLVHTVVFGPDSGVRSACCRLICAWLRA